MCGRAGVSVGERNLLLLIFRGATRPARYEPRKEKISSSGVSIRL